MMSNVFTKIFGGVKTAAVDTEHVLVDVADALPRVAKAVEDAITAEPQLKTVITGLIAQIVVLGPEVLADIAAKGINLSSDLATLTQLQAVFAYFQNDFLPVAEKFIGTAVSDLDTK